MTNTGRTLTNFIKNHCNYVSITDQDVASSSRTPALQDEKCPICLTLLAEATPRIVKVNLETCHHIIDDECLSRYLLAGFHRCPFCRVEWFDRPDGATTDLPVVAPPGLDEHDLPAAVAPLIDRSTDNESEITWIRSLMRTQDTHIESSGPVGSGPLFQEWPDWLHQEADVNVVDTPSGPPPMRLRRRYAVVGGAHEYRRRPSEFVEDVEEELTAEGFEWMRRDEAIEVLVISAGELTYESEDRPSRRV